MVAHTTMAPHILNNQSGKNFIADMRAPTLLARWPIIGLKSPAFVNDLMIAGFYMGKDVITVPDIVLATYFIFRKYWQELAMMTIGWSGSALLLSSLSTFLPARGRQPRSGSSSTYRVLSGGHAISFITFYGLIAYLLVSKMRSASWKIFVVAAALLITVFVSFSHIFMGGHYLTDILAGYVVGIAWFGGAYALIEIYFKKRRSQNVKKE